MFATYLLNVFLQSYMKANNRFLFIACSFPLSLTRCSRSHSHATEVLVAHPSRRCVSDTHEHSLFRFSILVYFCSVLLYCLYLLIFWNRHYSVCVYFSLTLLSLILFITILDLLLFIGNNILVCVCMVFMLLLVRSHVCPIFFIVFFLLDRFIHIICVCVSSVVRL